MPFIAVVPFYREENRGGIDGTRLDRKEEEKSGKGRIGDAIILPREIGYVNGRLSDRKS